MSSPRVLIPWFPGTNCHQEMKYAFDMAGGDTRVSTIQDLRSGRDSLTQADIIGLAGGFSYGDHVRSGSFAAHDLLTLLRDQLLEALGRKVLILGICNGFQILMETGILPGNGQLGVPTAVLDRNVSARFCHKSQTVVHFRHPHGFSSPWVTGLAGEYMVIPSSHGEGRLMPENPETPFCVVATYGSKEGDTDASPNGSPVAGICSPSGLVMGMMPHPERRLWLNPTYLNSKSGLALFEAGIRAVR